MYRARIFVIALAVLAVLTGTVYFSLKSVLTRSSQDELKEALGRQQRLFGQTARVEAVDFVRLATGFAAEHEFQQAFEQASQSQKRSALFVAVEARNTRLARESRKADLFAVTDAAGKVLVRDLDPNVMFGDDLKAQYPSVGIALGGTATKDVWTFKGRAMRVATAPIRVRDGSIQGALVIGFVMTDREARQKAELFNSEVAFVFDGKVIASSFVASGSGDSANEDVARAKLLGAEVFAPNSELAAAIKAEKASPAVEIEIAQERFMAVAQPWPGNAVAKDAGVVFLRSVTRSLSVVSLVRTTVLVFGALAALVLMGALALNSRRFLGPLDQIESGVAEVINGNLDYVFPRPGSDYEGLANGLNALLARLLGRPDSSDDEMPSEGTSAKNWRADTMFEDVEGVAAVPGEGAKALQDAASIELAREPLDAYYKRTYDEYMAAKKRAGDSVEGVTVDSFRAKLSQNETVLRNKYKCKGVRFRVVVKGNQVTLKPIPIY